MHITEIMLYQLQKKYPQYQCDFMIDKDGWLVFWLEEDAEVFCMKYWAEDDEWQVTIQTISGNNHLEAYYPVKTFEDALEIYFNYKNRYKK